MQRLPDYPLKTAPAPGKTLGFRAPPPGTATSPGGGGASVYVFLSGEKPVKYTDPDGRFSGLKNAHENFKKVVAMATAKNPSQNNNLGQLTQNDKINARNLITRDSRTEGIKTLQFGTNKEISDYSQKEISRYEAFAEVRGEDIITYGTADRVMSAAEFRFKRAESEARFNNKSEIEAKRYAENEANKIIDEFISNHNPNYIPPEPISEK